MNKRSKDMQSAFKLNAEMDMYVLNRMINGEPINYVFIPDVHGMLDKLKDALHKSDKFIKTHLTGQKTTYVFGGDYIDRGPDSSGVIKLVKEYVEKRDAICLLGNHDTFLTGTADGESTTFENGQSGSLSLLWAKNGGAETCFQMFGERPTHFKDGEEALIDIDDPGSYIRGYRDVIKDSWEYKFLKEHSKLTYVTKDIYFCHAPQSNVKDLTENSLLWSRNSDFTNTRGDIIFKVPGNKRISVHGHYHRLREGMNFPRINYYQHGELLRIAIMADSGCGCGTSGELHPVIVREYTGRKEPEIVAIL